MNDLSTSYQQGEGGIKENPPCTPLKENKGRNLIFTAPVPVPIARTYAPAQGTPNDQRTGTGTGTGTEATTERTGTGSVCIGNSRTGTGTGTRRITVDSDFILKGYSPQGLRYDPVQTAMMVFNLPLISNGRNNAKILRWHVRRLGEETFRELMYDQWRENGIDGAPESVIRAFTRRCFKAGGDVR